MVVLWNETEVVYFLLFVKIPGLCGNPNMASFKLESKRNRVGRGQWKEETTTTTTTTDGMEHNMPCGDDKTVQTKLRANKMSVHSDLRSQGHVFGTLTNRAAVMTG